VPTRERHVVVVGGGIVGLCAAYYLRKAGVRVTVLERAGIGSAASGGNAGWIVPAFAGPFPGPHVRARFLAAVAGSPVDFRIRPAIGIGMAAWLWRCWGRCTEVDRARGVHALGRLAEPTFDLYEGLAADGVAFELHRSHVLVAFRERAAADDYLRELAPMAEHGYRVPPRPVTGPELRSLEPALSPSVRAGFEIEDERHVRPEVLLPALGRKLLEMGTSVIEGCEAIDLVRGGRRIRAVSTPDGPVDGSDVVLALGAWEPALAAPGGGRVPVLAGKGYSFSARVAPMPGRPVYLADGRLACTPRGDRLRVAGSMEIGRIDPRIDPSRVGRMLSTARRYLAGVDPTSVRDAWTGMRPMTPDGLPIMGRAPWFENLYVCTGHSTLGMTLGPASGMSIAELVLTGKEPAVLAPFRVDRW
jgi:D-amino-acid dehydrogenase